MQALPLVDVAGLAVDAAPGVADAGAAAGVVDAPKVVSDLPRTWRSIRMRLRLSTGPHSTSAARATAAARARAVVGVVVTAAAAGAVAAGNESFPHLY
jgi:hypothetical protein